MLHNTPVDNVALVLIMPFILRFITRISGDMWRSQHTLAQCIAVILNLATGLAAFALAAFVVLGGLDGVRQLPADVLTQQIVGAAGAAVLFLLFELVSPNDLQPRNKS